MEVTIQIRELISQLEEARETEDWTIVEEVEEELEELLYHIMTYYKIL